MILKLGVTRPLVGELKVRLNHRGAAPLLTPTNYSFGPLTDVAVRKFQRDAGLKIDGVVDTNFAGGTWDSLLRASVPATSSAPMSIGDIIVGEARHFLGLTEVAPNARWDDLSTPGADPEAEELRQALLAVGWQSGWPYCAAAGEAVSRRAYEKAGRPDLVAKIAQILTPGAVQSFRNAERLGLTTRTPVRGALVFWQHGRSDKGHEAIVEIPTSGTFGTIEFNTDAGGGREGDGVYRKERRLTFTRTAGLNLLGFLPPLR